MQADAQATKASALFERLLDVIVPTKLIGKEQHAATTIRLVIRALDEFLKLVQSNRESRLQKEF